MVRNNHQYDAIVVGAGPNGLAAAITLAIAGKSVCVYEARETVGGGARSEELTLPGFVHDVCSSVYPLGIGSPFFRTLPLDKHGLEWVHAPAPVAHPLDDGFAVMLERSVDATAAGLGRDARAYRSLMSPIVSTWDRLAPQILGPASFPRHPAVLARFGIPALWSAVGLAKGLFKDAKARALFTGVAAHSMLALERPLTASFGLVLAAAGHSVGWPLARGGAQNVSLALASYLRSLGGEILTSTPVESIDSLPGARAYFFDTGPHQMIKLAHGRLPSGYQDRLRKFRYGPGVFKMDWALLAPIPWRAEECGRAATVHLGGTLEEIAQSEREVSLGGHPERPFVLIVQPSLFDSLRAPLGRHTAWAYCHVPGGSTVDMTDRIERQIERFAPGFRDCVLARSVMNTRAVQDYNPNYVGGDINGGIQDLRQMFTRPGFRLPPYSTPAKGIYICSSSTPPGGGVHGMCGHHAARAALRACW